MSDRRLRACRALMWSCLALVLLLAARPARAQDTLDLTKAIKVGSGPTMVIEFTDPDCPYCRKAEAWFARKPGVTRYIFLIPLASHPASKGKVQYILSARDKAKAYQEVFTSSFDPKKLAEITPEGIKLQKEHQEIARDNKMSSTPSFMIYGRIIVGFDQPKLEQLVK